VVIETDRLLLRRVTVDDIDELVEIHGDPAIVRFIGAWDRARAMEWLTEVDQNWQERGYGRVAITDRESGRLLGRTGLMYLPLLETLGLRLSRARRRRSLTSIPPAIKHAVAAAAT
jgi:RimJ/RimL family protein N-acetyltransferase